MIRPKRAAALHVTTARLYLEVGSSELGYADGPTSISIWWLNCYYGWYFISLSGWAIIVLIWQFVLLNALQIYSNVSRVRHQIRDTFISTHFCIHIHTPTATYESLLRSTNTRITCVLCPAAIAIVATMSEMGLIAPNVYRSGGPH